MRACSYSVISVCSSMLRSDRQIAYARGSSLQ